MVKSNIKLFYTVFQCVTKTSCCTLGQLFYFRNQVFQKMTGKSKKNTAGNEPSDDDYDFTIGGLIRRARIDREMTQEELAQRVGTTKSYISKIEKNVKEVRLSTLQRIVEQGLGGELKLSIKL